MSRTVVFDTVFLAERETVWMPPDSNGRQYPLRTVHREGGKNSVRGNETVTERRDTCFAAEESIRMPKRERNARAPAWLWAVVGFGIGIAVFFALIIIKNIMK